ncbi:hypothetical protein [Psychrobacter urativorans]|uniref:hypothetical protein n=1 Tax=Psychrobacter urativorans TaxID=45610 RepID=UPI0019192221|nr:hypothetical protein [Psychrobacter urativorans]
MNNTNLNLGNSIFDGFNDQNGLMICGYEWGFSKKDEKEQELGSWVEPSEEVEHTFANKARHWGEVANTWRYDNSIKRWFELWDFPLDSQELGGDFEKSIIQTNWADTQGNSINDSDSNKFLLEEHVDNFIRHVEALRPKVIIFMGSKLMDYLQNPAVLTRFEDIMGEITEPRHIVQKESSHTKFKVQFQSFENCQVIGFPHPSGSHGISYDYIELFQPEMNEIISKFKDERKF